MRPSPTMARTDNELFLYGAAAATLGAFPIDRMRWHPDLASATCAHVRADVSQTGARAVLKLREVETMRPSMIPLRALLGGILAQEAVIGWAARCDCGLVHAVLAPMSVRYPGAVITRHRSGVMS